MSDHVAKSYYSSDAKVGQSIDPYQSAWMAHWAGPGCDTSTQKHHYSFSLRGDNIDDHGIKPHQFLSGAEIARSANGFRKVEYGSTENFRGLAASSRNLTDGSLGHLPLPTAKLCRESQRSLSLKREQEISSMQALRPQTSRGKLPAALNVLPVSTPAAETSTGECQFQPEGLLPFPVEQVKYHMFFGESNYSCSRQRSTVLASNTVPNRLDHEQLKFDSGRTVGPSFIHRQEEIKQVTSIVSSKHVTKTNLTIMGQEDCNYQGHSSLLVCGEKRSNFPECQKSATSYPRQNNMTALNIGSSTTTYNSPAYDNGQYHGMQNHFGSKFFPTSSRPSEMNNPSNLPYGQCMLNSLPHCVHDVLDSAEGLAGGQSRFSQTIHSLLITKHTDFNLSKEKQILGESRPITQQNSFSKLHRTFPMFNCGKQGVKLQLLGSSTDSEEKEDAGVVKTSENVQKNESSAETAIMDMESFKEKDQLSDVNISPSNKDMMMNPDQAPQISPTTAGGSLKRSSELPDINLELAAPASPDSIEKPEPSTSRTQSLDMELLLANADRPGNSKSTYCQDTPLESELSSRWVKRLKLTTPKAATHRINNSNLEEPFSHDEVNKLFGKTMKCTTSSTEPTTGHRPGKELMALDQTTTVLQTGESSSRDTGTKDQDMIGLSHAWIQRWRHNKAKKKPETLVTCDPLSSKLGTEDLEKKQFPSIAAMALMGKVMNGFQPCQFQKKGSFMVWSTKNL